MKIVNKLPNDLRRYISHFVEPEIKYAYNLDNHVEIEDSFYKIVNHGTGSLLVNDIYKIVSEMGTKINDEEIIEYLNPYALMHYDYYRAEGCRKKEWYWDDENTNYEIYITKLLNWLKKVWGIAVKEEGLTNEINKIYAYIRLNGECIRGLNSENIR